MKRQCNLQYSGFTLIELMVVMLMISIILAVAIPRFEGGMLQDATKTVTRRMINTVRALRSFAVQKQQVQLLLIDIDNQRFWTADAGMDKETVAAAAENAFELPESVRFIEILFPRREPVTSGIASIFFYPAGYSDHAVVHFEKDNEDRYTYIVEPLLPKVKLLEKWIEL